MTEPMIVIPESVDTPAVTMPTAKAETLSFKAEDFAKDIAQIAKEQGVSIAPKEETPTPPVQPETPATVTNEATKPVAVPEKFQKPDGSVDPEKLGKSMANVDEALASYLAKEKELKRKMNDVRNLENPYLKTPAPMAPNNAPPINPDFAAQLESDLAKDGFGKVAAKLFTAAQEAAEERMQSKIQHLQDTQSNATTRQQIEAIGKSDPWVYTPEGMATLTKVLEEQPYLWQAPDPYKAAYLQYNGQKNVVSKSSPQVLTPNPIARPSAPVPTGQAASQANNGMNPESMFDKLTPNQKAEFINRLPTTEQEKWFVRAGFPKFDTRR